VIDVPTEQILHGIFWGCLLGAVAFLLMGVWH